MDFIQHSRSYAEYPQLLQCFSKSCNIYINHNFWNNMKKIHRCPQKIYRHLQILDRIYIFFCAWFLGAYKSFAEFSKLFFYYSKSCGLYITSLRKILQELWIFSITPAIFYEVHLNLMDFLFNFFINNYFCKKK